MAVNVVIVKQKLLAHSPEELRAHARNIHSEYGDVEVYLQAKQHPHEGVRSVSFKTLEVISLGDEELRWIFTYSSTHTVEITPLF